MSIRYQGDLSGIHPDQLRGFFVGWPNPPSTDTHLRLLQGSYAVELAIDETTDQVVGFCNAISDGVLTAYLPLLEVLPSYQSRSIGAALIERLLGRLRHLYMVDLVCDAGLRPYYERFGMVAATGMMARHYDRQSG